MEQTKRNFTINIISLIVNVFVGLLYTPYLVNTLGISAYGIVPLALLINQYISVVTGSLTGALTRFYSVSIEKNDTKNASVYLSSSLVAILSFIVILLPFSILLIIYIDSVFNIPIELVKSARWLFSFTLIGFFFSLITSLLNVPLYAKNRLDNITTLKIFRVILKTLFAIAFLESFKSDISFIGFSTLLSESIILIASYYYFIKYSNQIAIKFHLFNPKALYVIFSMTFWVIIHQLGDTGLYRTDSYFVNKYFGVDASGILGAFSEFSYFVTSIVSVVSTIIGPLILISYSKNDHKKIKTLAYENSLLVGLITAIIVGNIIGFSKPIISLWLNSEFDSYYVWFILKQLYLPFYTAAGIYAFVFRTWNRVVTPALITIGIGVINIIISYFICMNSDGSERYVNIMLLITTILIFIQSYVLNTLIFYKIYPEIGLNSIFSQFFKILMIFIFVIMLSSIVYYTFSISSFIELFMSTFFIGIVSLFISYLILQNEHKNRIKSYLRTNKYLKP